HARDIVLLAAQNPVFAQFYAAPGARGLGQHRHLARPAARQRPQPPAALRGHRDVPRQTQRERLQHVRARTGHVQSGQPRPGSGPAGGDRTPAARAVLPAGHRPEDRRGPARRGAGPVAPPRPGLIPPADFLPLAEETGLMHALTRYVLETALDQYVRWRADGLDLQISVNLSPTNCMDTQLPADLLAMLEARELPPRVLRLEVTEYAACACWAPTAS